MKKGRVGNWSIICDVCGFRFLNTEVKKRWDGLIVCEKDFETKHPQLTIRTPKENVVPPFVRPPPGDVFIEVCTEEGRTSIAGMAVAGCWIAGYISKATFGDFSPILYPSYTWDTTPFSWDAWGSWDA
jgi:hypothetical protein